MTYEDIEAMAKRITSAYSPILKNKETETRNKSCNDMVTSYSPAMAKHLKEFIKNKYNAKTVEILKNETKLLMFRDENKNSNKYHYFTIIKFDKDGEDFYSAVNCSGRIGFIEREYDLTELVYKKPAKDLQSAKRVMDSYINKKEQKGYVEIRLRHGSANLTDFVESLGKVYDDIKSLKMKNQRDIDNNANRKLQQILNSIDDLLAYSALQ